MSDRRLFKRVKIGIPVTLKFLGTPQPTPPVTIPTSNVSYEGFLLRFNVTVRNGGFYIAENDTLFALAPFLLLNQKLVYVDMTLPPRSETLQTTGEIVWYDFGTSGASYYLEALVFFEEMSLDQHQIWREFISHVADKENKDFKSPLVAVQ
jgi:hypothetical protein